jgi:hypothetical protein
MNDIYNTLWMNFGINVSKISAHLHMQAYPHSMSSHALVILNNMALVILNNMAANDSHGQLCLYSVSPMMHIHAKKTEGVSSWMSDM